MLLNNLRNLFFSDGVIVKRNSVWAFFIVQMIITVIAIKQILSLERQRSTESINPKTAKDTTEL